MLFLLPLAKVSKEECFAHGKIYTSVKGSVVDSIDVALKFREIETIKDIEVRIAEKERVLEIIKSKRCKF